LLKMQDFSRLSGVFLLQESRKRAGQEQVRTGKSRREQARARCPPSVKGIIGVPLSPINPNQPQPPDGWDIANARDFAAVAVPNEPLRGIVKCPGWAAAPSRGPDLQID
jgi:hypothetical protein